MAPKKVAFISSFLPRKCGIATFTSDLIRNVGAAGEKNFVPAVLAMENIPHTYDDRVVFKIKRDTTKDYVAAADYINFSGVTTLSLQHEFGLYGGDAGSYINLVLKRVSAPIITTLHTILEHPDEVMLQQLTAITELSDKVVVMSERSSRMLRRIYRVPDEKIVYIPHGVPDIGFVDSKYYKQNLGFGERTLLLTFGLIAQNKGIEFALQALPRLVKRYPSILYAVVGATHPEVVRHEGEAYRLSLMRLVKELGLEEHVVFVDRFVNDDELKTFLSAADIYLTPYLVREQAISGTLSFALGAGKAIVSTPYWYAEELLANDRGIIVPFRDARAISDAIEGLLRDGPKAYEMRERAYQHGRDMTWSKAGVMYWDIFSRYQSQRSIEIKSFEIAPIKNVPQPLINHLLRLTDDTGIFQHAKFIIPDRTEGYCTDDNARALETATLYYDQYREKEVLRLLNVYLSFISYAQQEDGEFRNFMSFDRKFIDKEGESGDQTGRALSALGMLIERAPLTQHLMYAREKFDLSLPVVKGLNIRGKAHAIMGLSHYLTKHSEKDDLRNEMGAAADSLVAQFREGSNEDWPWFEDVLSYDNGVLPRALFTAARLLGDDGYREVALDSCNFLLSQIYNGKWFSFVGSNGWYPRGGEKAQWDQQAVEAASTVQMLGEAFRVTGDVSYFDLQHTAFNWFLGVNDVELPLYDFKTHGCCDGLHKNGVNLNQGAESLLSYLLALFSVIETTNAPI
ncbi:MAG TPA: glycosyltransferase [Spirochaetia bacterium]|nr:glycosyltransferase [Spirochaetia bacterium]